jgi:hypothetical protein
VHIKVAYFRLVTTIMGINITDYWMLAGYHNMINWDQKEEKLGIQFFAEVVGKQLIDLSANLS